VQNSPLGSTSPKQSRYTRCVRLLVLWLGGDGEPGVPKSASPEKFLQVIVNTKEVWRPQYEALIYADDNDDKNLRMKGHSSLQRVFLIAY